MAGSSHGSRSKRTGAGRSAAPEGPAFANPSVAASHDAAAVQIAQPEKISARSAADETVSPPHVAAGAYETAPAVTGLGRRVLTHRVLAYDPDADAQLLDRAHDFAEQAHGGQTRKSGEPYFQHPLAVAGILTELRADAATVATALLHDVVEDTAVSIRDIEVGFGEEIARLVDGVTKVSELELKGQATKQAENFRKFVIAMAEDVRVLLIKLADRLHNMRTIEHHADPEKRRRIATETLEIYAPLAGRVGVQRIRDELEDLSFKEISPPAYETMQRRLEELRGGAVQGVVELRLKLQSLLDEQGVRAEVFSREKRPYSIWRKMMAKNVTFDDLADIFAFRIIVATPDECYRTLGLIHQSWRMIPHEFDDYVSAPKPNGYRSIHTSVIGPPRNDGGRQKIEFQIRTREMHEAAERGVAAHWQYKESGSAQRATTGAYDPYEVARQLVDIYKSGEDIDEVLRNAKIELFQDQVFCFTPKGFVVALPKGATPIDFAYAVHTDIGDSCVGAKINGVASPLRTALKNGDVVQILRTNGPAAPPPEWESIVTTGRARAAMARRVRKMQRADKIALGRQIAENVFAGARLEFSLRAVRAALARIGEKTVDDVLEKIGEGKLKTHQLLEALYPGATQEAEGEIRVVAGKRPFRPRAAIEGLPHGAPVKMSSCCSPIPGDRIVGIKQDDGLVRVHTISCERLAIDDPVQDRWIDLRWRRDAADATAFVKIVVTVRNEIGVLSDVAGIIAHFGVSIANIKLENRAEDFVEMLIDVEVKDARQLAHMMAGLGVASNVIKVERAGFEHERG